MFRILLRRPVGCKCVASCVAIAFFLLSIAPRCARADNQVETIYQRWEEVSALRAKGEFDRAIDILNQIIREHSDSEEILKRAYNNLIFTLYQKKDEQAALAKAREALERFPELSADTIEFPAYVQNMYERLRGEMFGALTITKPGGCRVFLDGRFMGETPLSAGLVRTGEYALVVTKSGYNDYMGTVTIDPGGRHNFEISLSRQRGVAWWLYRVTPFALVGAFIGYMAWSGGGEESVPQPLPGPPNPPAR